MKPTDLVFRPTNGKGKTLAYVDITFDELLTVKNFKIIDGEKGMFLAMPSQPSPVQQDGKTKYFNTAYFVDAHQEDTPGREYTNKLQNLVLTKWQNEHAQEAAFEDQTKRAKDKVPF